MLRQIGREMAVLAIVTGCVVSCSESTTTCTDEGQRGIELTIRTQDGTDVGLTTWVELVRLDRVPVDSAQGLHDLVHGSPIGGADEPGRYRLRVRRDGFVSQELLVTVPSTGACNEVITQEVTIILLPVID